MKYPLIPLRELATATGLVGGPFGSSLGAKDYVAAGVPVIRGINLAGRHVSGDFVFVSSKKFRDELARNSAQPGDLIFTQRGTLGQVAIVHSDAHEVLVVSQSQMRLRVDAELAEPKFIYYACSEQSFLRQVADNSIASGVPHINLGILGRLVVPVPDLSSQSAIADVLGALDDKIAVNGSLADAAEALAVALVAPFEPSVPLCDVVVHHKRTVFPEAMTDERVEHFSLPALDAGHAPVIDAPSAIKSGKFEVGQPSVLVSKLNPRFPRIWDITEVGPLRALASTEFLVLESLHSSSTVLWSVLSQPAFSSSLESQVAGTSGSHQRVRPTDLLATEVIDPRTMSDRAKEQITALGRCIASYRSESLKLAQMRDTLLPELMAGRLRVKDAERAVEEVL